MDLLLYRYNHPFQVLRKTVNKHLSTIVHFQQNHKKGSCLQRGCIYQLNGICFHPSGKNRIHFLLDSSRTYKTLFPNLQIAFQFQQGPGLSSVHDLQHIFACRMIMKAFLLRINQRIPLRSLKASYCGCVS